MVRIKEERGLALMVDALIFLTVLSVLSTLIMFPSPQTSSDPHQEMVTAFHCVMLRGEMPQGDGGALSRLSLADHLLLLSHDPSQLTPQGLERLDLAVNSTLMELEGMGLTAWWTLTVEEDVFVFGMDRDIASSSIYVHQRSFGEGRVTCALSLTV
jgi:hypothetical protein